MGTLSYKDQALTDEQIALSPLVDVLACFESIGNNCEFGIVQKHVGYDPPGLFRNVGFIDIGHIIDAIQTDFAGMFDPGTFEFTLPDGWGDWRLDCPALGFGFHTTIPASLPREDPAWAIQTDKCLKVFRFLKEKIRSELREGHKIFVFRSLETVTRARLLKLLSALRMHGENALFFVRPDSFEAPGTLRFEGGGLVLGSIDRLSNENPPVINLDAWFNMCRNILMRRDSIWSVDRSRQDRHATHLLPPGAPTGGDAGPMSHYCHSPDGKPRPVFSCDLDRVAPNTLLTVSAWIYLPSDFIGGRIDLVFLGYRTERFAAPQPSHTARWQKIFSTSRVPPDASQACAALLVMAPVPCVIYSAGWTIVMGGEDSEIGTTVVPERQALHHASSA